MRWHCALPVTDSSMRHPPSRSRRGWFWRLKSTRLSLVAGLGSSLLCVVFWLGWQRELHPQELHGEYCNTCSTASRQNLTSLTYFAEVLEDSDFWEAARYDSTPEFLPLLNKDRKARAAVTLGRQGRPKVFPIMTSACT